MTQPEQEPSKLLTLKQACQLLSCHPNTLRAWDKSGTLIAVRFGKRGDRRYRRSDIEKVINEGTV